MQYRINIHIPGGDKVAAMWFEQFCSWLDVAPASVATTVTAERIAPPHGRLTVEDVVGFFRDKLPARRVRYNARSVFYWLVEHYHDQLIVRCTTCNEQYGYCPCPNRGQYLADGTWVGDAVCHKGTDVGQDYWYIERFSIWRFDEDNLIDRQNSIRLERVIAFIGHIKGR